MQFASFILPVENRSFGEEEEKNVICALHRVHDLNMNYSQSQEA
jgi:hypothetical protein